jgi:hypothetical protein
MSHRMYHPQQGESQGFLQWVSSSLIVGPVPIGRVRATILQRVGLWLTFCPLNRGNPNVRFAHF